MASIFPRKSFTVFNFNFNNLKEKKTFNGNNISKLTYKGKAKKKQKGRAKIKENQERKPKSFR